MKKFSSTISVGEFESYEEIRKFKKKFPEFNIYHEDYKDIKCEVVGDGLKHLDEHLEDRSLEGWQAIASIDNPDEAWGVNEFLTMWIDDWKRLKD